MTPEERNLITELFDRLATLEGNPRDASAVRAINEGLDQAPNAIYALVQTVLVQDEALKHADARIRELEGGGEAPREGSFLDGLRSTIFGRDEPRRAGSVPSVRPEAPTGGISSAWRNTSAPPPAQPAPPAYAAEPARGGMGSSFLGTAAAAAAGVVGGSLLMSGMRSMMGPGQGQAHSAFDPGARDSAPWGGDRGSGGDLSRQAGLDDMGRAPQGGTSSESQRAGLFDSDTGSGEPQDFSGDSGDFDTGDTDGGDFTD